MLPPPPRSTLFPYTTLFRSHQVVAQLEGDARTQGTSVDDPGRRGPARALPERSEEHTSELQSRGHLVCRHLLEKKKQNHHSQHDLARRGQYIRQTRTRTATT